MELKLGDFKTELRILTYVHPFVANFVERKLLLLLGLRYNLLVVPIKLKQAYSFSEF